MTEVNDSHSIRNRWGKFFPNEIFAFSNPAARFCFILFTVMLPLIMLAFEVIAQFFIPSSQFGFRGYLLMFLNYRVMKYSFPFLLHAIISMILLVISYERFSKNRWIRYGIYSGTFWSTLYTGVEVLSIADIPVGIFILCFGFLVLFILSKVIIKLVSRSWRNKGSKYAIFFWTGVFIGFPLICLLITLLRGFQSEFTGIVFLLWVMLIPPFASIFSCIAAAELQRNWRDNLFHLPGFSLFATHTAVLGFQVLKTIEEYNKLPSNSPDCYVATAAACGHASVVHSWEVKSGKRSWTVNTQLLRLKGFEILLLTYFPTFHKMLRRWYNKTGPDLARFIQKSPFLCDLVYYLLKPIEYMAGVWIFILPKNTQKEIYGLYSSLPDKNQS